MSQIKEIKTAQEMKDILEPIPADQWCAWHFHLGTQCCFLGHINKAIKDNPSGDFNGFGARQLTAKYLKEKHGITDGSSGASVNNEPTINGYTEPVIKDRVMHLIDDMIKDGY